MTHPIVIAARALRGKPFRHRGRGPVYYDCAGVALAAVQAATGRTLLDLRHYGREPAKDGLRAAVEANAGPPILGEPEPGDVGLFCFVTAPHHLAVFGDHPAGGLSIIHARADVGVVCETIFDQLWRNRLIAAYRVPV